MGKCAITSEYRWVFDAYYGLYMWCCDKQWQALVRPAEIPGSNGETQQSYWTQKSKVRQVYLSLVILLAQDIMYMTPRLPSNPLPLVNKALALFQWLKDFSGAEKLCCEVLMINPSCEPAVATLAQLTLQKARSRWQLDGWEPCERRRGDHCCIDVSGGVFTSFFFLFWYGVWKLRREWNRQARHSCSSLDIICRWWMSGSVGVQPLSLMLTRVCRSCISPCCQPPTLYVAPTALLVQSPQPMTHLFLLLNQCDQTKRLEMWCLTVLLLQTSTWDKFRLHDLNIKVIRNSGWMCLQRQVGRQVPTLHGARCKHALPGAGNLARWRGTRPLLTFVRRPTVIMICCPTSFTSQRARIIWPAYTLTLCISEWLSRHGNLRKHWWPMSQQWSENHWRRMINVQPRFLTPTYHCPTHSDWVLTAVAEALMQWTMVK